MLRKNFIVKKHRQIFNNFNFNLCTKTYTRASKDLYLNLDHFTNLFIVLYVMQRLINILIYKLEKSTLTVEIVQIILEKTKISLWL